MLRAGCGFLKNLASSPSLHQLGRNMQHPKQCTCIATLEILSYFLALALADFLALGTLALHLRSAVLTGSARILKSFRAASNASASDQY